MSIHLMRRVSMFLICLFVLERPNGALSAQDPKKPSQMRIGRDRDAESEGTLPKYSEMVLPSAEEFLRSKPFDWLVLKNQEVLVAEPIAPRPDTLVILNSEYERYLKGRAGMVDGEERLKEKRLRFLKLPLTLIDPGVDQDPDYVIEAKFIQRIEYFEDLVLRRANELIGEEKISLAYDLLLLVDRRHRENNIRLKEAYENQKQEEAAAKGEEERIRFSVPEVVPLRLSKTWPKFDETYHKLLLKDAELRAKQGDHESALRLLENLWDRNPTYPELSETLGRVVDRLMGDLVEQSDFRQARHFLGRLASRDAQHPIALKWKSNLLNRATQTIADAKAASAQGEAASGSRLIELAARIWPDAPGLKDTHRELIDRYQSVRLGVLRLPGDPTTYPFDPPAESAAKAMTHHLLFEPFRVDERGVRYRSSVFESWEPADLGRQVQFTLRPKRADWEARPTITAGDILAEFARRIDPIQSTYDERLAGAIERVTVQSPSQFTIHFRRLPLRLEALVQFAVQLGDESMALNSDLSPDAIPTAGRQRFYEDHRDDKQVSFRRARLQPVTSKSRNIDEIELVRYDSWEHTLQGLLRGEVVGIPQVGLRDLKSLQNDTRFFVVPYALPVSHFILFHPHSAPARDGQFRRALSISLPREELLKQTVLSDVNEPHARLTATPFPTKSYGYNRLLTEPTYDPQRAAALALTAKKQLGGKLPVLRMACPPDPVARSAAGTMIEHWRRVGITVELNSDSFDSPDNEWDLVYCTRRIIEPVTELWPLLSMKPDASVESLKPMPERVRRQLLELERTTDWPTATKLLFRIETELLVEARFIPLWEVDEFFVTRRHLLGLPSPLMHSFHDAERWKLQSWYPQEAP